MGKGCDKNRRHKKNATAKDCRDLCAEYRKGIIRMLHKIDNLNSLSRICALAEYLHSQEDGN